MRAALSVWAELRGICSLSEVAEMLRQDVEAMAKPSHDAEELAADLVACLRESEAAS